MWDGHVEYLKAYYNLCWHEWARRGFQNIKLRLEPCDPERDMSPPSWLGNEEFHASHRSNLLRKDPEHYGQFGWTEPDNLPYYWPVKR